MSGVGCSCGACAIPGSIHASECDSNDEVCPRCGGDGETLAYDVCPRCDGEGYLTRVNRQKMTVIRLCPECRARGLSGFIAS